MKEVKTTNEQIEKIKKIIQNKEYHSEVLWTYLIGDIIVCSSNPMDYLNLIYGKQYITNTDFSVWFEGSPWPPRKGMKGSQIDLALGNIRLREGTNTGIIYYPNNYNSWVCFIEGKFHSDIKRGTINDPLFSNQLMRDIEILLCFQSNKIFPKKLFFTLITPRVFQHQNKTPLYRIKFNEYINDKNEIMKDIGQSQLKKRANTEEWIYPSNISKRLDILTLNWISYEDIFEKKFDIKDLNLIEIKENSEHLHLIEEYLDDLFHRL